MDLIWNIVLMGDPSQFQEKEDSGWQKKFLVTNKLVKINSFEGRMDKQHEFCIDDKKLINWIVSFNFKTSQILKKSERKSMQNQKDS